MLRQQVGERDIGVVAAGAVAGRAGGHEDRAGQHGGGFEHEFVAGGRHVVAMPLPLQPLCDRVRRDSIASSVICCSTNRR